MKCTICGHGETVLGITTLTLERDMVTIVFKGVPARICDQCDEEYVDETIAQKLFAAVEEAARCGVQVEIRTYTAA